MEMELNTHHGSTGKMESSAVGEVNAFLANLDATIRKGDLSGIEHYYAEDFCVYDMMPPIEFSSKKEYMTAAWKDCFTDVFEFPVTFDRHHKQVRVSGNTAYVHNLIHMKGTFRKTGEKMECWMRHTSILENRGGRWLIVHEHNSIPVANDGSNKGLFNLVPKEFVH